MGHSCRICGMRKANEKFSGAGHKRHICKECSKLSKDTLIQIEQSCEIAGFMEQSNISRKNMKRLQELAAGDNTIITESALLVLEVAKFRPYKKRRIQILAKKRPLLLRKLKESGLIFPFYMETESSYPNFAEEPDHYNNEALFIDDEIFF